MCRNGLQPTQKLQHLQNDTLPTHQRSIDLQAKVPTCHTCICGCIEQLCVAPVEKAGAAITTEGFALQCLGNAGGVWGVGVAWAAHVACLATVLRHWQALRLAFVQTAVVASLAPPVALWALGIRCRTVRNILATKRKRCTTFESGASGAQDETTQSQNVKATRGHNAAATMTVKECKERQRISRAVKARQQATQGIDTIGQQTDLPSVYRKVATNPILLVSLARQPCAHVGVVI
jgi:hypothetical protein